MAIRFGMSATLLILPKFLRTRKMFWIVDAIEFGPLSPGRFATSTTSRLLGRLKASVPAAGPGGGGSHEGWVGINHSSPPCQRPRPELGGGAAARAAPRSHPDSLLDLDLGAGGLELLLDLL